MDNLFDNVHASLQGTPNRRCFYNADCPFCGKPAKPGHNHFGYNETGYRCFVCGAKGALEQLAGHLRLSTHGYARPTHVPPPEPKPIARWRQNPAQLLDRYRDHPRRFDAWRRYKALSAQTVSRFDFGLGRLPFQREDGSWYLSRQEWLIVPLYEDGQLVGLLEAIQHEVPVGIKEYRQSAYVRHMENVTAYVAALLDYAVRTKAPLDKRAARAVR
ncbi:MAG TPA: hypothetical protein VNK95_11885 [Caldilineaceae bacterium]|nr:hypothetical protein [Caldilineaceae bacterium]